MPQTRACRSGKLYGSPPGGARMHVKRLCLRRQLRADSMCRGARKSAVPGEPAARYSGKHAEKVRAHGRNGAGGKNTMLQIEFWERHIPAWCASVRTLGRVLSYLNWRKTSVVRKLQRLAALSVDERWLLARAAALVASIRIASAWRYQRRGAWLRVPRLGRMRGQVFLDDSDVAVRFVPIVALPAK